MGSERRPRIKENGGGRPKRYNNAPLTYEFRLQAIRFFEASQMQKTLERFYPDTQGKSRDIKCKLIYLWVKNKAKIERGGSVHTTRAMRKLRKAGTATVLSQETELQLVEWITDYRAEVSPVSAVLLYIKALKFAEVIDISSSDFTASWTWRLGFLKRHGLRFRARTRQGQNSREESAQAVEDLNDKRKEEMHRLGVDVVHNANQTPACFEHARKLTPSIVLKTNPSNIPEMRKQNCEHRYGFGKHLWKEIRRLQDECKMQTYGNKTGWWNAGLSVVWLDYNFNDRIHPDCLVLLLWDDFSSHWTDEVKAHAKTLKAHLFKVPGGHTSVCQPVDIAETLD
ncbi:hypothetical protein BBJ28_00026573 [Nothophytophthora sp. Chile5]|nr:hypothetical protein BBJ28_00026573 [Nothophytophthora sp. Chile5]